MDGRVGAAALALSLAWAVGVAATSCTGPPPALQLIAPAPLTVRGLHFRAGERVTLVIQSGTESSRQVAMASDVGVFVVRLPDVRVDRCTGYTIRATGESGNVAILREPAHGCPPAAPSETGSPAASSVTGAVLVDGGQTTG